MDTKQKLDQALRDALRSGNEPLKRAIRLVRSTIKLEEVNKGHELDEAEVIGVIQKEIKIHQIAGGSPKRQPPRSGSRKRD